MCGVSLCTCATYTGECGTSEVVCHDRGSHCSVTLCTYVVHDCVGELNGVIRTTGVCACVCVRACVRVS